MNPDQALACMPQFSRTGVPSGNSYARWEPLALAVRRDRRYPSVVPLATGEEVHSRYGVEIRAFGTLGSDGGRLPDNPSGSEEVSQAELFHVQASLTLTDRRLIGAGAQGNTLLGPVAPKTQNQMLYAVDLAALYSLTILRAQRGRRTSEALRLHLPDSLSGMLIRVIGRLAGGKSKVSTGEVAQAIVETAVTLRLNTTLDPDEVRRVEELRSGAWQTRSDATAHVRHPDDVSAWTTAWLDADLDHGDLEHGHLDGAV